MMRQEEAHNSAEQVREYVVAALELVAELEPPADLRAAVFSAAVGLIAAKQIVFQQSMPLPAMAIPRGL